MTHETDSERLAMLRERAEQALKGWTGGPQSLSPEELQRAVHELHVYELELEMQNEELRRVQEELAAARDKYADLYDFASVGYFTLDETGRIREANMTGASLLGVERGALIGKSFSRFVAQEDADGHHVHYRQLIATREARAWEVKLVKRDGVAFKARLDGAARSAAPEKDYCRIAVSDISQRVELEDALRRANEELEQRVQERTAKLALANRQLLAEVAERERLQSEAVRDRRAIKEVAATLEQERSILQTIMEGTQTMLVYLDRDFNFVHVNTAYAHSAGFAPEELIGRNHFELYPHAENQAIFEQVRTTGEPVAFHAKPFFDPHRSERGTTYWDWTLEPVVNEWGQVAGLVFSLLDVTEVERARQAREAHLASLNRLIELSEQVLAEATVQGVLRRIVDAACKLTGACMGAAGHGYQDGVFRVGATARSEDMRPCAPEDIFQIEQGGVYKELIEGRPTLRLTQAELEQHPAWWGLPEGHAPLRGLLGARMVDRAGVANGLIMVSTKKEGDFSEEDEALLAQLAALASLGLQHIEAREEAERRAGELDAVFSAMAEALTVYSADGAIVRANPAAQALYGLDPRGMDRATLARKLNFRHPNGQPMATAELPSSRALNGEPVAGETVVFTDAQGDEHTIIASAAPMLEGERVVGVVVAWRDITERKRMEDALRRYAERLAALHEVDQAIQSAASAEEIAEVTLAKLGQLIPYRQASVTLFDLPVGEQWVLAARPDPPSPLGKGARSSLREDLAMEDLRQGRVHVVEEIPAHGALAPVRAALRAQGVRSFASLPLRVGGELIGSLNLGMEEAGGPAPEQMEIARQVTDELAIGLQQARLYEQVRRHAEELEELVARRTEALQASEERFRAIFEGASIGVATTDLYGQVLTSNPALQAMLGYGAEDLRRMALMDFTHPDERASGLALFHELAAGRRRSYSLETRLVRKDDQQIWGRLALSVVRGAGGWPRFAILMVEDITAQKQAQAALVQSEKLAVAGRLAASLAHEINNPLQSVIGCLGLAQEALAAGEDAGRYLSVAGEELRRTARIVAQLRDLHRTPDAARREAVDVNEVLEAVLAVNQPRARQQGVEVEWQPAEELPALPAVAGQLQQVFLNLLLNAVEAMPGGGRVRIRSEAIAEPAGVRVRFEDTGPGIAEHVLARIFEPFYSTRPDGLGLGLFISHNIIAEHGGTIEVQSQMGEGTTFTVWLPVE